MIVVSHRGPYTFTARRDGAFDARRGAGGVVSALGPLLERHDSATWVAAAIGEGDREALRRGRAQAPGLELRLLDLDPALHHMHYDVVSNAVLWFLHHRLFDLVRRPRFDARFHEAWEAYAAVNRIFAGEVAGCAAEGDVVLVQDYQLALVPGFLRAARPDLRVLHFTHTPFAGPDDLRVLPAGVARDLCASLAGGPAGFHTRRWAAAYEAAARDALGPAHPLGPAFAASLGPDRGALDEVADSPEAVSAREALEEITGDRAVIVRTDRVEPSKNLVRGFLAYDAMLEARPDLRERVVFVALVYASREALPEYLAYTNEVEQAVAHVNDRWARGDWLPVVLDVRDDFPRSVAGLQRYDVLLVNPLRDGLNLVAKEGPLLNRRDGVLCLSRGAGAFEELGEAAVEVHAYDVQQSAAALAHALDVEPAERAARARRLRDLAGARSPATWLDDLLTHT